MTTNINYTWALCTWPVAEIHTTVISPSDASESYSFWWKSLVCLRAFPELRNQVVKESNADVECMYEAYKDQEERCFGDENVEPSCSSTDKDEQKISRDEVDEIRNLYGTEMMKSIQLANMLQVGT